MASPRAVVDLNEDDTLPPPPKGSELFARLNVGNTGTANHVWIPISSHTAKCDLCLEHNKSVCQRCTNCNRQLCRKCIHTAHSDGIHSFNDADLDWTPAPPVRRGPRGTSSSAVPLSITGRRSNTAARSSSAYKVSKASPFKIQTHSHVTRSVSGKTQGAGITRPVSLNKSDKSPSKKSKTQATSPVSKTVSTPSPKEGNSFFLKSSPLSSSSSNGKVTIKINGDKIHDLIDKSSKLTGDKVDNLNTDKATAGKVNKSSGDKVNKASISKTALNKVAGLSGTKITKLSCTKVTKPNASMASTSKTALSNTTKPAPVKVPIRVPRLRKKKEATLAPPTPSSPTFPLFVPAANNNEQEEQATLGTPPPSSPAFPPFVPAANNHEQEMKAQAWETNEILLDLRRRGQDEDAQDMLEHACALLELGARG